MDTEKQKPILVYVNEREITHIRKKMDSGLKNLEELRELVIEILPDMSDKEIAELPYRCVDMVREKLRSKYQFPNATDEFNLKALGIDPRYIYSYFQKNYENWINYQFDVVDKEFTLSKIQREIDRQYAYAETPEQIFVYNKLKEALKLFNELKEIGIADYDTAFKDAFKPGYLQHDGNLVAQPLTASHEKSYQWLDGIKAGRIKINMPKSL